MAELGIPTDQIGADDPYRRIPWRAFVAEDLHALVAQATTIGVDHFLIGLTLAWALIVLAAGLLSAARPGGPDSPPLAYPASARP